MKFAGQNNIFQTSILQNCLFILTLRYAQNFILEILSIYLWKYLSHALILKDNPNFTKGSNYFMYYHFKRLENYL